ncbi:MAG: OsmC family protein [Desulfovibrionaceae bacterium]
MRNEEIVVSFEGGMRVDARVGEYTVATDQSADKGGQGSAPNPFQLFLASLATCSGIYALRFCESRKIDTTGLRLVMRTELDASGKRIGKVTMELGLPAAFPEKYRGAIVRAVDLCTVKKHILTPPEFVVEVATA